MLSSEHLFRFLATFKFEKCGINVKLCLVNQVGLLSNGVLPVSWHSIGARRRATFEILAHLNAWTSTRQTVLE